MSPTPPDIRKQVIEQIIDVIREAQDQGFDGVEAARFAFPGTPDAVLWSAWAELEDRTTAEWWRSVERTVEGELIKKAIAVASEKGGAQ